MNFTRNVRNGKKGSRPVTGLGNLKDLNDTKLVLNDHEVPF